MTTIDEILGSSAQIHALTTYNNCLDFSRFLHVIPCFKESNGSSHLPVLPVKFSQLLVDI